MGPNPRKARVKGPTQGQAFIGLLIVMAIEILNFYFVYPVWLFDLFGVSAGVAYIFYLFFPRKVESS